jgi:hypothetical protein
MNRHSLLKAAIEDNVAWCAAVSTAHGAQESQTEAAWANLATAPRYYPNVITRRPGAQAAVAALVERFQGPKPWSIKDSFRDLDLHHLGFAPVIDAQWLGGTPASSGVAADGWERVDASEGLSRWAEASDGGADSSPFKPILLNEPRVGFWQLRRDSAITAGAITFASGQVIGLSNWFASGGETAFSLGLLSAVAKAFPGRPVVLWSEEEASEIESHGLHPLGLLRVWTIA